MERSQIEVVLNNDTGIVRGEAARREQKNKTEQNRKEQGYERSPPRLEEGGKTNRAKGTTKSIYTGTHRNALKERTRGREEIKRWRSSEGPVRRPRHGERQGQLVIERIGFGTTRATG